ncbi:hypothetical protein ON010_g1649 [Phytophthora cinnamomi]|nr:hypothetical protein ON010_g1649 [Phytophthora cinnamomi]
MTAALRLTLPQCKRASSRGARTPQSPAFGGRCPYPLGHADSTRAPVILGQSRDAAKPKQKRAIRFCPVPKRTPPPKTVASKWHCNVHFIACSQPLLPPASTSPTAAATTTVSHESRAHSWKMEQVKQLQAEGNALYADGRYDAARASYTRAIALLTAEDESASNSASVDADAAAWKALTAAQLLSNRAQTAIQERDFAAALRGSQAPPAEREGAAAQARGAGEPGALRGGAATGKHRAGQRREARADGVPVLRGSQAAAAQESGEGPRGGRQRGQADGQDGARQTAAPRQFRMSAAVTNSARPVLRRECEHRQRCSLRNNSDGRYKLVFQEPLDPSDVGDAGNANATGKVTLNGRGKASFRVAVVLAGASEGADSTAPVALQVRAHEMSKETWNLFPVVSLPFTVVPAGGESKEGITGDLGVHCCRAVAMDGLRHDILLAESPGNLGIGGKLWDSCLVLTRYLAARRELLVGKQVVELGSGLGLVGIFCAMLGAKVTLTDMQEVIPLLEYNIRLNFTEQSEGGELTKSAAKGGVAVVPVARAHLWGEPPRDLPSQLDVLVLSDVVYDPVGYAPLVSSLEALSTTETLVLMAHRSRNPMEHQFFELLARSFSCEQIDWLSTEKTAPKASPAGGPPTAEQALQDVKIFEIRRLAAQ